MKKMVLVRYGERPDAETQKLIEEKKLLYAFTTTGGIVPGGLEAGTYYKEA